MHTLLEQQIAKTLSPTGPFPVGWQEFLAEIEQTYLHYEKDRSVERESLGISSENTHNENQYQEERQEELERLNNLMIGRELKMVELKQTIGQLQKENDVLRKGKTP